MNVVESKEDMNDYLKEKFTVKGVKDLNNLASSMAKIFYETKEDKYPIKIGLVFGFPLFHYNNEVKSKDEMSGRLKLLSQILGLEEIHFESNGKKLLIELKSLGAK